MSYNSPSIGMNYILKLKIQIFVFAFQHITQLIEIYMLTKRSNFKSSLPQIRIKIKLYYCPTRKKKTFCM